MTNQEIYEQVSEILEKEKKYYSTEDWNVLIPALLTRFICSVGDEVDRQDEELVWVKKIAIVAMIGAICSGVVTGLLSFKIMGWL